MLGSQCYKGTISYNTIVFRRYIRRFKTQIYCENYYSVINFIFPKTQYKSQIKLQVERWLGILPSVANPIAAVEDDPIAVWVEDS